ncbi:hypothetical protein [Pseudonocardia sp. GCM10023141]|uniref:hypothetical protein n=1 Tax=Pseudonocardia sp. GCM10023141 TaxID=3252653 RepID=UPI00361466F6
MARTKILFRGTGLEDYLQDLRAQAARHLETRDIDRLLATPEAEVIEGYEAELTIECPQLLIDQGWSDPIKEVERSFPPLNAGLDPAKITWIRMSSITFHVPFTGNWEVFDLSPTESDDEELPRAFIGDNTVQIIWQGNGHDHVAVDAHCHEQLRRINTCLDLCKPAIDDHHQIVGTEIPRLLTIRREKLLADRQMQARLSFKLRSRPDANTHAVPIQRRQLAAKPTPPVEPFRPELVLESRDYEAALDVLRHSRNALERSPSLASKLGEEHIRDLLLINLNAQFEGAAAGEVFNSHGKTDILIRAQDRNVFIGECKIWRGPKTVKEALGQLLSYMVWRDTKAALILFIKDGDVTTIIKKAVNQIEAHPNFKRRGQTNTDERVDFVMLPDEDPAREIHLAFLPFLIRKASQPAR